MQMQYHSSDDNLWNNITIPLQYHPDVCNNINSCSDVSDGTYMMS